MDDRRTNIGYVHQHLTVARDAVLAADHRAAEGGDVTLTLAHGRNSLQLALAETVTALVELRAGQEQLVAAARAAGMSWGDIADGLATSPQAAHERYRHLDHRPRPRTPLAGP